MYISSKKLFKGFTVDIYLYIYFIYIYILYIYCILYYIYIYIYALPTEYTAIYVTFEGQN